jgi:hypothetical protein
LDRSLLVLRVQFLLELFDSCCSLRPFLSGAGPSRQDFCLLEWTALSASLRLSLADDEEPSDGRTSPRR